MNKIRKYLIHLLGGVTGDELQQEVSYYFKAAKADELQNIKWIMESCYGQSAEEWCQNVYERTCERLKKATKDFDEYADGLKINQIEAWIARDENRFLYLYLRKPKKVTGQWTAPDLHIGYIKLGDTMFPEVQWSDDEPTKVKLVIDK